MQAGPLPGSTPSPHFLHDLWAKQRPTSQSQSQVFPLSVAFPSSLWILVLGTQQGSTAFRKQKGIMETRYWAPCDPGDC